MLSASSWNFSLLSRKAFSVRLRSVMMLADGTSETSPRHRPASVAARSRCRRTRFPPPAPARRSGRPPPRRPGDRFTQPLLDVRRIGPPVGVLEGFAEHVFRLQTRRRQRRPVGLDEDSERRHQSHEHRRPKSVYEIAQALLTLLRRFLADAQFLPGLVQLQLRRAEGADQLGERFLDIRRQFAGVVRHSCEADAWHGPVARMASPPFR